MDIKCRRTSCEFNRGHTCNAARVDISTMAMCHTFERDITKPTEELDLSRHMFESAPEYANSRHIKNVALKCKAQGCLFNKECKCRANGITVIDDHEHSRCATYIEDQ